MRLALAVVALLACADAEAAGRHRARMRAPAFRSDVVFAVAFSEPGCWANPVARTGQAISVTRASAATVVIDGVLTTCAAGELRVNEWGALVEPGRTQYLLQSAAPAGQSVTLATGAHCAWTDGGSVAVTAGTAVVTGLPCSPTTLCQCPFNVTGAGTVSVAFAGGPVRAQVENGAYRSSFIASGATAAMRQADNVSFTKPPGVTFTDQHAIRVYVQLLGISGTQFAIGSSQNYSPYLRISAGTNSPVAYHADNATGSTAALSPPLQVNDSIKLTGETFRAGRLSTAGSLFVERVGQSSTLAGSSLLVAEPATIFIGSHNSGSHLGGYIRDVCISRSATGCPL